MKYLMKTPFEFPVFSDEQMDEVIAISTKVNDAMQNDDRQMAEDAYMDMMLLVKGLPDEQVAALLGLMAVTGCMFGLSKENADRIVMSILTCVADIMGEGADYIKRLMDEARKEFDQRKSDEDEGEEDIQGDPTRG